MHYAVLQHSVQAALMPLAQVETPPLSVIATASGTITLTITMMSFPRQMNISHISNIMALGGMRTNSDSYGDKKNIR